MKIPPEKLAAVIKNAIEEDVGPGDITTEALIPENSRSGAVIVSKGKGVAAGVEIAGEVFRTLDGEIIFAVKIPDGSAIKEGDELAEISGSTRAILTGERTALNLLGRLSGIATAASRFAALAGRHGAAIMDTRKTTPGLRALEKYAVSVGGGQNHRMGLYDAVLIKDNHIEAAGGDIGSMIERARKNAPPGFKVEVEAADLAQLEEAVAGRPDIILLDNMAPEMVGRAVGIIKRKAPGVLLEVSGNISLENVEEYARTGVDMISAGALTHSVKNFDFSLRIDRRR